MHKIKFYILFSVVTLFFVSHKTYSQFETDNTTISGYYVKLKLETTSDWTEIKFNAQCDSFLLVHDTILGNPRYSYNHYNDYSTNYFNIIRSDTQSTGVEYTLFYPVLPVSGISITNTKGWLGITRLTVTLHCRGNDTSIVLSNALETNVLTLPVSFLRCAEADTLLLPAPAACPQMLAFYYPWYGNVTGPTGAWVHWDPGLPDYNAPDTPSLGYYDSYDYSTIHQHILWAQQYGLSGFVCSWWGIGDFSNGAIQRMFNVADTLNFSLSIYYEPGNISSLSSAQKIKRCINDITYIVNTYGSRRAMLRYKGEPVIFIYGQTMGALNLAEWQQVLNGISSLNCKLIVEKGSPDVMRMFDGVHTYNPVFKSYAQLKGINLFDGAHANLEGKIYAATAAPGFLTVPRNNGLVYYVQLGAALAYKPHYVLITSFNEWHEASETEPSRVYGFEYMNYTLSFRNYLNSICNSASADQAGYIKDESVRIFPNPSSGDATIKFDLPSKVSSAVIVFYDQTGRTIKQVKINPQDKSIKVDNTILSSGLYFYEIITTPSTKIQSKKMIIVK